MLLAVCAFAFGLVTYLAVTRQQPEAQPIRIRVREKVQTRRDGERL